MQAALVQGLDLKSRSVNDGFPSFTPNHFTSSPCFLPPMEFAFAAWCGFIVFSQTALRVSKTAPFVSRLCQPQASSAHNCFGAGFLPRGQRSGSLTPPKRWWLFHVSVPSNTREDAPLEFSVSISTFSRGSRSLVRSLRRRA